MREKRKRYSESLGMREVSIDEYLDFVSKNGSITIGDQVIPLEPIEVKRLEPLPEELLISRQQFGASLRGVHGQHIRVIIGVTGHHKSHMH